MRKKAAWTVFFRIVFLGGIRMNYQFAIIGAGVIGGMVARELSKYTASVCLLEKESDVAMGASKANSGIIHGGFDPEPNTKKARLNSVGVEKLFSAARELNVPHRRNGSLVCAFSEDEAATLEDLLARGRENHIPDLRLLDGDAARALEPELSPDVVCALHAPNAGIICPYELTLAAVGNAMDNGVTLYRNFEVCSIEPGFRITSTAGEVVKADILINCAGLSAHKIADLAGDHTLDITPVAGEYLLLDKAEGSRVSHTVFQVPNAAGKGVLVTPTVDGNLLLGPTATPRSGTETTADGICQVISLVKKSVPNVDLTKQITSFCGVRAKGNHGDFLISASAVPHLYHAAAIDSPGLTCCVAIAEETVSLIRNEIPLTLRSDWNGHRPDPHAFRKMNDAEKTSYIQTHPDFGRVVCRCEGVSEGEIRAACRQNPKAHDIDGVKRRTRAGMGRCQGGFCLPHVLSILAEEHAVNPSDVTKHGGESKLVWERGNFGETL